MVTDCLAWSLELGAWAAVFLGAILTTNNVGAACLVWSLDLGAWATLLRLIPRNISVRTECEWIRLFFYLFFWAPVQHQPTTLRWYARREEVSVRETHKYTYLFICQSINRQKHCNHLSLYFSISLSLYLGKLTTALAYLQACNLGKDSFTKKGAVQSRKHKGKSCLAPLSKELLNRASWAC